MKKYLALFPFIFIFLSCEKTQIVESDASYQDYIVVNSELNPWKLFAGVTFTRTLPIGIPYDIKSAELKNVKAYIKINGVQIVPLHYVGDGLYKPKYNELIIEPGNSYELFADWEGTLIYANTTVPIEPVITEVSYNTGGNYLQANIQTQPNEVYGALWVIGGGSVTASAFPTISVPGTDVLNVHVITSQLPELYREKQYNGKRNIQVFAFDNQYTAYFNSAKGNIPAGNAFTQNSGAIGWNVLGNNVIGMFIGVAKGKLKNVN